MDEDERLILSPGIWEAAQLFKRYPDLEVDALKAVEEAARVEGVELSPLKKKLLAVRYAADLLRDAELEEMFGEEPDTQK
jgi:hypothetical protein